MLKKIFNKSYLKENFRNFTKYLIKKKLVATPCMKNYQIFSLNHTIQGLLLRLDKNVYVERY